MKRVRCTEDGAEGFAIRDSFQCCDEYEELVVYDNTNVGCGTLKSLLVEIPFIVPIPDLKKCGAGKGDKCCIFLTVGKDGFNCERFTELRDALIFRTMNAKRDPKEPYPHCMNQGE